MHLPERKGSEEGKRKRIIRSGHWDGERKRKSWASLKEGKEEGRKIRG